MLSIPEGIGLGGLAIVQGDAGIDPVLGGQVEAVNMIGIVIVAPQAAPPEAIIPP